MIVGRGCHPQKPSSAAPSRTTVTGEHILGLFVTFEGPEGCGKTSQLHLLAAYLRDQDCDVLTTREPGGTPISERVRAIVLDPAHTDMEPTTEFLLFSAARAQHVAEVIRPHLERGGVVLCDRFADSSLAYQGYGYGLDLKARRAITHFATGGLVPDLTVLLDLPVEVGLLRKAGGRGDAWNRMDIDEFYNIRGIWGFSPTDVYTVGEIHGNGVITHWDGSNWDTYATPTWQWRIMGQNTCPSC